MSPNNICFYCKIKKIAISTNLELKLPNYGSTVLPAKSDSDIVFCL